MSEDKVQVKIEADANDFQGGLKNATSSLTDSIKEIKTIFSDLATGIKESMGKTAQVSNDAGKSITDGIRQSAAQTSQTAKTMATSVEKSTVQMTTSLTKVKAMVGSIGIGIVGIFGGAAKETIAYEKSLLGLSRTSGLSIESTSRLAYAASQYGLTTEDLGRNVGILSRNIAVLEKDTDSASNVFNRFGIDVHDTNGKLFSADQIILQVADRFKSMPDGVQKTALAMSLFGRQGQSMIPMLNQGSAGIQKLGKDAEKLGLVFKDVEALKAYSAATKQYNATMKSLQVQLGTAVLPVLTAFSKSITSLLKTFNQLDPAFKNTIVTTAAVAGSVAALTLGWGAAASALAAFGGPFARVGTMMQTMPNLATSAANGVKSLVVGMTNATVAIVKYVATGGIYTTATNTMRAASTITATAMHGVRTAVLATTLAYNTGGIKSVLSYGASLVTMNGIAKVARVGLMLLYGTVTAGIAVVVGLATAWTANFGGIQEATAGTCDGIIYGLNNFADGVGQIASGIGKIFTSLALTIGKALVGDFSGAIDEAKGLLDGITSVGAGAWGAMKGLGQTIYGAASDPEGAMRFGSAAWGSLKKGATDMFGFDGSNTPGTDMENVPDFAGADGNTGKEKDSKGKEESAYEKAKKLYEQQIQLAEYSATEKEQLYKKYLENIAKSEQEAMDYRIGLYALEKETLAEKLHEQEVDLENSLLRGEISEKEHVEKIAEMKRQSLESEVTFRAKAAMEQAQLTEEEKTQQLSAYKEKIQATIWYKESLKSVLEAEKSLSDFQKGVANKLADFRKEKALQAISDEEERLNTLYERNLITQKQLIDALREFEEERYILEKGSLEKSLDECAINADKMKDAYQRYVDARDQATQEMIINEMIANGKSADEVIRILKEIDALKVQHDKKESDLNKNLTNEKLKEIEQIRTAMKDSMSQSFQDILTKQKTLLEGIKNVWSTTMKSILKQFTDKLSEAITLKGFDKQIKKASGEQPKNLANNLMNKQRVVAEQATQAQLTAANAQGNAQRLAQDQMNSQQQVMATETKVQTQETLELAKDATITASAQAAGQAAVGSIESAITAMIEMLPMLILMSVLTGMFGGGGSKTTESTGDGINLGRSPESYYKTPTLTGIPSFDVGSWRLPADTLAMVHQDEMIVPAKGGIADGVRNLLENGGGGQSIPAIQLSYSAAHYGRTNKDVQAEMKQNAKFLVKTLNSEYRNFNRGKK